MYPSKRIALIIPDVLRSIGLKCLIEEFFPDHEAISFQDFRSFMGYAGREGFDYYITDPEIHVRLVEGGDRGAVAGIVDG